ncbi:hypothetical protein LF41_2326 [Lysobacter dokdonensis DS-58]|uniref:Secreted protein n=1 Tax=Lysobacter dokdonensis DS-58 TaxID=1300345 RepID=A0A0A2WJ28_9GAMM|nr:hypothetical protein [Lysobacter dokdonensis]KGQ19823.1 hypothetical protein LF41_2326 [Lysobacter dokdonensis DS-58]
MRINRTLCLLALALVATTAIAQSRRPHFLRAPSASLGSPRVIVQWTEVELLKHENVSYIASAKAGAHYQCVYRSNQRPSATHQEDVLVNVSVGGTFTADKYGKISDKLIIPAPQPTLVCPSNQVLTLVSVVFTDIRLTDVSNYVSSPTHPSALSYKAECAH